MPNVDRARPAGDRVTAAADKPAFAVELGEPRCIGHRRGEGRCGTHDVWRTAKRQRQDSPCIGDAHVIGEVWLWDREPELVGSLHPWRRLFWSPQLRFQVGLRDLDLVDFDNGVPCIGDVNPNGVSPTPPQQLVVSVNSCALFLRTPSQLEADRLERHPS